MCVCERRKARVQYAAAQAGAKPKEAHKRTLELEGSAEALGPAQKKRIVEGGASSAAAAASPQPEPAHGHPGQQNGLGSPHACPAAAAQPNGREHSASAAASSGPAQPQALAASVADMRPGGTSGAAGLGDPGVISADMRTGTQQAIPAGPHGVPAKQQPLGGAAKQGAQTSREATPELCIDRIDGKTGQVSRRSLPRRGRGILGLSLVKLCARLQLKNRTLTPRMTRGFKEHACGCLSTPGHSS